MPSLSGTFSTEQVSPGTHLVKLHRHVLLRQDRDAVDVAQGRLACISCIRPGTRSVLSGASGRIEADPLRHTVPIRLKFRQTPTRGTGWAWRGHVVRNVISRHRE
ncbi:MAG TPA: hypothetical protein VMS64_20010 [Candidatus Methylomirabilis sp.]|nr:hypothetical protein [Candidatus Methylomirabilis sp.]